MTTRQNSQTSTHPQELLSDHPIKQPAEDRYGIDPFAQALANSILNMKTPGGLVIGLNGPWGSGKSSAINLCKHHLQKAVEQNNLVIINFSCWWFRGEEALTLAFFQTLYSGLGPSLSDKIKKNLSKIGAYLLQTSAFAAKIGEKTGVLPTFEIAETGLSWLAKQIKTDKSIEILHQELSEALQKQTKRFLIILDDIDRLSPDDALLIFQLAKSVGHLPNITYLLAYDRPLAEKIVSERYPSEGPHYLEKIIQVTFDLPHPQSIDIEQHLKYIIESICHDSSTDKESEFNLKNWLNLEENKKHFWSIFHEGLAPAIRTPRDISRFANSLQVSWPSVKGEVDFADFLAVEMLRLLHPTVYHAIRQNKKSLCNGITKGDATNNKTREQYFDSLFFNDQTPNNQHPLKRLLKQLFLTLKSAWGNINFSNTNSEYWDKKRRICSPDHFDTYFRFHIGDEVLSNRELQTFLQNAHNSKYVRNTLRTALTTKRKAGGTQAAVWLTELKNHAQEVEVNSIKPLLTALFEIADEVHIHADEVHIQADKVHQSFFEEDSQYQLHWLLRALTMSLSIEERSKILYEACNTAALGWLAWLTNSIWQDYHPINNELPEPPNNCLTTEKDAETLQQLLCNRVKEAAQTGKLLVHKELHFILDRWTDVMNDEGTTVRKWTNQIIDSDEGVLQLTQAFTFTQCTSEFIPGYVSRKYTPYVERKYIEKFTDSTRFRFRVEAVAATGQYPDVQEFLEMWQRAEKNDNAPAPK